MIDLAGNGRLGEHRVVSWNDAAEMNESVEAYNASDALEKAAKQ